MSWSSTAAPLTGSIVLGDINSGTTVGATTGFITGGSKTSGGGASVFTVNFADIGTTSYMPIFTFESTSGTPNDDNDLRTPVIFNKTSSSFQVHIEEESAVVQAITMYVTLIRY